MKRGGYSDRERLGQKKRFGEGDRTGKRHRLGEGGLPDRLDRLVLRLTLSSFHSVTISIDQNEVLQASTISFSLTRMRSPTTL